MSKPSNCLAEKLKQEFLIALQRELTLEELTLIEWMGQHHLQFVFNQIKSS